MTRYKLVSLCLSSLALIAAPACGDREKTTADSDGSSSSSTAGDSTTSGEIPTTSDPTTPTTTGAESGSGGATDGSSSSGNTSVTTEPPACMDPMEGAPNNTECADASGCGCESGKCFLVPILGGWCGECLGDDDCAPGGCTVPNPIDGVGSTCNQGEPGAGCQSDAVCTDPANLHCGSLLAVENIIDVSTCGECGSNADCADPKKPNCSPTYDVMNFTGKYVCIEDGAVPNAEGCNLTDDGMGAPIGNAACMSGFCGEANVMGLLKVGVCGECNSNEDCMKLDPPKTKCNDPQVDLNAAALVASFCS